MNEELSHAWETNKYLHSYIRSANLTGAALLTVVTFLLGAVVASLPPDPLTYQKALLAGQVLLSLGCLTAIASIFSPDLSSREETSGTIFWEQIQAFGSSREFAEECAKRSPLDEVQAQNYAISRIATAKYKGLKRATWLVVVLAAISGATIVIAKLC